MTKAALNCCPCLHGPWNSDSSPTPSSHHGCECARTASHSFSCLLIPRDLQPSPSLAFGDSPHCAACLTSHNSVMGHVSVCRYTLLMISYFSCPIQRRLSVPLISPLTECLMGYNTKFPFFCRPLARVYSQMLFIAVVTSHQMATWFRHSNGTKERDLSSTVFSISRFGLLPPPPPRGAADEGE